MRFKNFLLENFHFYDEKQRLDWRIAYLYQQNLPISEIKKEISVEYGDISMAEIYRSLKRNDIQPNRRKRPYLNDVIYYHQSGLSLEEIASLTGYTVRHVRNIVADHSI